MFLTSNALNWLSIEFILQFLDTRTQVFQKFIVQSLSALVLKVLLISASVHLLFIKHWALKVEFSGIFSNTPVTLKTCSSLFTNPIISFPVGSCPGKSFLAKSMERIRELWSSSKLWWVAPQTILIVKISKTSESQAIAFWTLIYSSFNFNLNPLIRLTVVAFSICGNCSFNADANM